MQFIPKTTCNHIRCDSINMFPVFCKSPQLETFEYTLLKLERLIKLLGKSFHTIMNIVRIKTDKGHFPCIFLVRRGIFPNANYKI